MNLDKLDPLYLAIKETEEQYPHRQDFNYKVKLNEPLTILPLVTILGAVIYSLCCIITVYVLL